MGFEQPLPSADSTAGRPIRIPCEPAEVEKDEVAQLQAASLEERGRLLAMACRAAARLDRSRAEAGLPRPAEEPWPESTWDFLRAEASRHGETPQ